jgi:hypothetical protein
VGEERGRVHPVQAVDVTADELEVRGGLTMRRWLNGKLVSESSTAEMHRQPWEIASFISTFSPVTWCARGRRRPGHATAGMCSRERWSASGGSAPASAIERWTLAGRSPSTSTITDYMIYIILRWR